MNERIKTLAVQASEWYEQNVSGKGISGEWETKFAELIVKECVRMCEVTQMSFVTHGCDVEASGAITVKQFIEEHFGVES